MVTPYLGEIRMFGGNYAPAGWAICDGSTLSINANAALFSLIGTQYGGNGTSTFNLPDLRGRVNISQGQGAGLSVYTAGEAYGTENVTLNTASMPQHIHPFNASSAAATSLTPAPSNTMTVAQVPSGDYCYAVASQNPTLVPLNPSDVIAGGGGQSHTNIMPVLAVTYIIALQGIFPSFN